MTNFSQPIDPMLRTHEIFQTPFSNNNNNNNKILNYQPVARQKHTHITQTGSNRIFKCMVPVDYYYRVLSMNKAASGTFPFMRPDNSFAFFLSQTQFPIAARRLNLCSSNSLQLSTWSPRFTRRDLYLRCRSLAIRA